MSRLLHWIHRADDSLLVLLLSTMIVLAFVQIVSRNLFDSGFLWIDPTLRVLVLWVGLVGAVVATRDNNHIRIDLFHSLFSKNTHRAIQTAVDVFSAVVCLIIGWYGLQWIRWDYEDGLIAFAGIPAWMLEVIVPLAFTLIGIRYLVKSGELLRDYLYFRRHPEEDDTA